MKKTLLAVSALVLCCFSIFGCRTAGTGNQAGQTANSAATIKNDNRSENAATERAAGEPSKGDVEFAREAFERLAGGDASAEEMVDWENLTALGMDVGAQYKLAPEARRGAFRKEFLAGFSSSFKKSGGSASTARNWRVESSGGDKTVVATDSPTGVVLLITVTHAGGRQKVSALEPKR
ncbi:MAG TPA: hypothetical protein VM934_05390 [Pyrinomonadaceae bacterium]|jgi:predicted small secreted protein|nr:hypothetical protein [Pyrinomonadaceae bacterium]